MNPTSGLHYHGINVLILGIHPLALSGDPRWMTYQQAAERKWQVKKGSKATTIFFTKQYEIDDEAAEDGKKPVRVLKHYSVFHASQVEGIAAFEPPTIEEAPWRRPESTNLILENSGAALRTGGDRAFYSPLGDFIVSVR